MRKEKKAALDVLAKASDVHNCWAILDDAVTSGEDDQFTKEYVEGEREMLEGSIKGTIRALGALGGFYGIVINIQNDNGSYAYMRKTRDEHLTELERAAEFDRGYKAGQKAMDAERQAIALKLRGLDLTGSSHENLSKMAYAIYPCATGWTPESCDGLREYVVRLIGGVTEPFMSVERIIEAEDRAYESGFRDGKAECDHGDCAERRRAGAAGVDTDVDEPTKVTVYDALGNERHKAVCELRNERDNMSDNMADNVSRIMYAIDASPKVGERVCKVIADRLIHLLGGDQLSVIDVPRKSCKNGDNCKAEANESTQSSKSAKNCKSGHSRTCPESDEEVSESAPSVSINDELRELKDHINAGLTPEMVLALRAEVNGISDRIEEQFARVCQQHEAVLQSTIEQMVDENLTVKDERDYWKREAVELQAKLDEIAGVLGG